MKIKDELGITEEGKPDELATEIAPADDEQRQPESAGGILEGLLQALGAPAVKTPVEEFLNHPLNISKSLSVGRILRGVEGIAGSLDYAVLDIVLGVFEYIKGKRGGAVDE